MRNIGKLGFSLRRVQAVFRTHFHSDHIDGLGELMLQRWVSESNPAPVPVYGPAGVETVVAGFMQAYAADRGYRAAHHGEAVAPSTGLGGEHRPFAIAPPARMVLAKDADLEIAAFAVDHSPAHPAVGYRIAYKGRSIVLSGDTRTSAAVQREAAGVDLLVQEAPSPTLAEALQRGASAAGRDDPNRTRMAATVARLRQRHRAGNVACRCPRVAGTDVSNKCGPARPGAARVAAPLRRLR
jgi:ribonuclease Z